MYIKDRKGDKQIFNRWYKNNKHIDGYKKCMYECKDNMFVHIVISYRDKRRFCFFNHYCRQVWKMWEFGVKCTNYNTINKDMSDILVYVCFIKSENGSNDIRIK